MHVGSEGGSGAAGCQHRAPQPLVPLQLGARAVIRCRYVQPHGVQAAGVKAAQADTDHREHVPGVRGGWSVKL